MNPERSWVRPDYKNSYTLRHEQTHFNITEVFARRFVAELNAMKIRSEKSSKIQASFDKWRKLMEETQDQYDAETKGGGKEKVQQEWNEKVEAELKRLKG